MARSYILTLSCPDKSGIVHAVSGFLANNRCNITESAQFNDRATALFFMRVEFTAASASPDAQGLHGAFSELAGRFAMQWELWDQARRPRVLIMVSKATHCLYDLLYRWSIGELEMEVPAVVSNHRDSYQYVASHDIPFHHIPVDDKPAAEARLAGLLESEAVDTVVLARYMQVLPPDLCRRYEGRILNIHHSFLPSFKGAKPYHQAFAKGVKLIGATAHYVTPDLDEGPIIEQDVARVDHTDGAAEMVASGRDVERRVLARALRLHLERRILLNDGKTVVFS